MGCGGSKIRRSSKSRTKHLKGTKRGSSATSSRPRSTSQARAPASKVPAVKVPPRQPSATATKMRSSSVAQSATPHTQGKSGSRATSAGHARKPLEERHGKRPKAASPDPTNPHLKQRATRDANTKPKSAPPTARFDNSRHSSTAANATPPKAKGAADKNTGKRSTSKCPKSVGPSKETTKKERAPQAPQASGPPSRSTQNERARTPQAAHKAPVAAVPSQKKPSPQSDRKSPERARTPDAQYPNSVYNVSSSTSANVTPDWRNSRATPTARGDAFLKKRDGTSEPTAAASTPIPPPPPPPRRESIIKEKDGSTDSNPNSATNRHRTMLGRQQQSSSTPLPPLAAEDKFAKSNQIEVAAPQAPAPPAYMRDYCDLDESIIIMITDWWVSKEQAEDKRKHRHNDRIRQEMKTLDEAIRASKPLRNMAVKDLHAAMWERNPDLMTVAQRLKLIGGAAPVGIQLHNSSGQQKKSRSHHDPQLSARVVPNLDPFVRMIETLGHATVLNLFVHAWVAAHIIGWYSGGEQCEGMHNASSQQYLPLGLTEKVLLRATADAQENLFGTSDEVEGGGHLCKQLAVATATAAMNVRLQGTLIDAISSLVVNSPAGSHATESGGAAQESESGVAGELEGAPGSRRGSRLQLALARRSSNATVDRPPVAAYTTKLSNQSAVDYEESDDDDDDDPLSMQHSLLRHVSQFAAVKRKSPTLAPAEPPTASPQGVVLPAQSKETAVLVVGHTMPRIGYIHVDCLLSLRRSLIERRELIRMSAASPKAVILPVTSAASPAASAVHMSPTALQWLRQCALIITPAPPTSIKQPQASVGVAGAVCPSLLLFDTCVNEVSQRLVGAQAGAGFYHLSQAAQNNFDAGSHLVKWQMGGAVSVADIAAGHVQDSSVGDTEAAPKSTPLHMLLRFHFNLESAAIAANDQLAFMSMGDHQRAVRRATNDDPLNPVQEDVHSAIQHLVEREAVDDEQLMSSLVEANSDSNNSEASPTARKRNSRDGMLLTTSMLKQLWSAADSQLLFTKGNVAEERQALLSDFKKTHSILVTSMCAAFSALFAVAPADGLAPSAFPKAGPASLIEGASLRAFNLPLSAQSHVPVRFVIYPRNAFDVPSRRGSVCMTSRSRTASLFMADKKLGSVVLSRIMKGFGSGSRHLEDDLFLLGMEAMVGALCCGAGPEEEETVVGDRQPSFVSGSPSVIKESLHTDTSSNEESVG